MSITRALITGVTAPVSIVFGTTSPAMKPIA
jgi:hypothetical protein